MLRARLLIIDDDPHFAEFATAVAGGLNLDAVWVDSGLAALSAYDALQPSLILLDLKMPGGDGLALLRDLALYGSKADILPCSAVDTRLLRSALRLGRDLGLRMLEPLRKPLGVADLEMALRAHVTAHPSIGVRELHDAIKGEITLHWQPKVSLASDTLCGAEVLSRWERTGGWSIAPADFVPLFEHAGLIDSFTFYVLKSAARQIREWSQHGMEIQTAVNLSTYNVSDLSFPDRCVEALTAEGVEPAQFILEVTETGTMNALRGAEVLSRLRLKGFGLALDDFGTGYSSLARLRHIPFSELKIDRSLVTDLGTSRDVEVLVQSTIDLAHNLGLEVCAEGVETAQACDSLRQLGCDTAQGYHISRPIPPDEFARWVSDRNKQ
jgi:EAL domain-containing protein (putative c-di-GMP-specific phosphodiesterase class I)